MLFLLEKLGRTNVKIIRLLLLDFVFGLLIEERGLLAWDTHKLD